MLQLSSLLSPNEEAVYDMAKAPAAGKKSGKSAKSKKKKK